jgi:hypothetical protein
MSIVLINKVVIACLHQAGNMRSCTERCTGRVGRICESSGRFQEELVPSNLSQDVQFLTDLLPNCGLVDSVHNVAHKLGFLYPLDFVDRLKC